MNVLIFGDSITHGQYDSRGGWANRLIADEFAQKTQNPNEGINYIYNLGIGGNTTRGVIDRMMKRNYRAQVVVRDGICAGLCNWHQRHADVSRF